MCSAYVGVVTSTVLPTRCISSSWRSVSPAPSGNTVAPSASHPTRAPHPPMNRLNTVASWTVSPERTPAMPNARAMTSVVCFQSLRENA